MERHILMCSKKITPKQASEVPVEKTKNYADAALKANGDNQLFSENSLLNFMDNVYISRRAIWLDGDIGDDASMIAIKQLNFWNDGSKQPVYIFINSIGGCGSTCFAIVDSINALKAAGSKVYTINVAEACSAAAVIFAAGSSGCRYSYPSARLMFHQGRLVGLDADMKEEDLATMKRELAVLNECMINVLVQATGKTKKEILPILEKDSYFSAKDAQKFGVVNKIQVFTI